MRGLAGKVAVVTGGGSGIGAATARYLADSGVAVVVVDIDAASAARVASDLHRAVAVAGDVSEESAVERYMAEAVDHFGRVDLYHLNAGIAGAPALFPEVTADDYDRVMGVNVRGVFLGMRAALRQFSRQAEGGAIVVTASIAAQGGSADGVPYHVSKHALIGLARCGAIYGGPLGIRVNAVAPGLVPTNMGRAAGGAGARLAPIGVRARATPLRRPGTASEVAAVVGFLLSDEAGFVTYSTRQGARGGSPVATERRRRPCRTVDGSVRCSAGGPRRRRLGRQT